MPEKMDSAREAEIRANFPRYAFPAYLGIEIESLETGCARLSLKHKLELTQGMGFIHGGALASLCDTAVGVALFTMTGEEEKILTIEFKVNFIAPAAGDVVAAAKILHKGRKTAVGEVDVTNTDGTLAAKALVTYYIYRD